MSMHEIEDAVADSIRLLDAAHSAGDPRVRSWIAALYRHHDSWDTSFTRFRLMDVLLRHGFAYRFPLDAHPEHAARREFFAGITEFTGLREFDEDAEDFAGYDSWLEDGYVDPPHLYCEAGTDLWRRMVECGALTGADAVPPVRLPLIEAVAEVAAAAEAEGDVSLIAFWYSLGAQALLEGSPWWHCLPDELAEVPPVRDLRAVVRRTRALDDAPDTGLRPEPLDPEDPEDPETWWFAGF
ncbi:hypothetical protein EDD29_3122 [Actinocorallia herbida]|uniref:Uncharacterized protein n=1 Tax=Actinocorallia herbida TaxID=58109 RepID=A0A3N1CWB1_9ACTN|nr:hypothetical protein [Actinocorallia herbida]ROO85576.1 hypothetical protein EDD29_3122 [Actinocorallia herbida]